jgi:cyclopropane fatty-acyl-phospholipid synthase-like methyltransferase
VALTPDAARLFSEYHQDYVRFIRFFRYPQGLRRYFLASPLLRPGLRVLDAGCGTGVVTLALRDAMVQRGIEKRTLHGFDLTPAMLERFGETLRTRAIEDVEALQADVLRLETLPNSWTNYDLVVSASMMEYVPRDRVADALAGLRERLTPDGRLVLFITRRNWLMRPLIGWQWGANLYTATELKDVFRQAGFSTSGLGTFPTSVRHLALWGHIVEARR